MELDLVCLSAYFKSKNRILLLWLVWCNSPPPSFGGSFLLLVSLFQEYAYNKFVVVVAILLFGGSFCSLPNKDWGVMSLSLPFRTSLSLSLSPA
jgi:hypothetical protein